jgi:predicted porin
MMKKTLVALAAVAVTGAYAQVSITGNIDLGVRTVGSQTITSQKTSIEKNNASTSTMEFKGSEDLGGGLKAGFQLQWTITPEAAGTENAASMSTNGAGNSNFYTGAPFNSEQFLSLSGNFGTVRVGEPNAAVYRAQFVTQPLGTAFGSGYSGTASRMGYAGSYGLSSYMGNTPGAGSSLRVIRMQRTAQYETPVFNGLSAMAEFSFGNDNSTTIAANTPSFMGLLINYNAGPLNLVAAQNSYKNGNNQIAGNQQPSTTVSTTIGLAAGQEVVYQMLGANYTMGQHTFYTGMSNVRASNATEDTQSWNLAYKFALNSNVDLMANMVSQSKLHVYLVIIIII